MFKKVNPKQNFPEMEREILKQWQKNKIFEKSVKKNGERKAYSFFDGPPFATGLPHYGHVVASLMKDVVPRYWTMRGYKVERRWGWDCHGLPIENLIEKEYNIKNKQDIIEWGMDKFNDACHASVLRYADEWKKFIPRIGRWVDMENDYRTMDWKYTESIWWVFSELYKKGLIYEGYKAMHLCPRCETTLSNFEVTLGYKEITDLSAYVKFKLTGESAKKLKEKILKQVQDDKLEVDDNVYILAWTTTPWTLPGNAALAVGENIDYVLVRLIKKVGQIPNPKSQIPNKSQISSPKFNSECFGQSSKLKLEIKNGGEEIENWILDIKNSCFVLAKSAADRMIKEYKYEVINEFKGKELVGLEYEPLFDYYAKKKDLKNKENGWKIYAGNFVSTEEGTGIVHIAPAFGEDDMNLGKKYNLPFIQHVKMNGRFVDEVADFREKESDLQTGSIQENGANRSPRRRTMEPAEQQVDLQQGSTAFEVEDYGASKSASEIIGREVKPKRNPRETDEKIVEWLEKNGKLFSKENYKHSYPHCWRCDTPLLNYATSSWFVKVTEIKDKMIKNNRKIKWVPEYIKEGRFGKWLEDACDWSVSRARFWGAPLPIWKCDKCGSAEIIGSIDELRGKANAKVTKFIILRHGESESNVKNIKAGNANTYHLTKKGIRQSEEAAEHLEKEKIDVLISSPMIRAKETAEIVGEKLGLEIIENDLVREYDYGKWNGCVEENLIGKDEIYNEYRKLDRGEEKYNFVFGGDGESRKAIEKRIDNFIKDCLVRYRGKNVLVVAHGGVNAMFHRNLEKVSIKDVFRLEHTLDNAKTNIFYADENGQEFNLHKPNIDNVEIRCSKCDGVAKIDGGVFDCWFESGSMPYAQWHYPFENQDKFENSFPAEFIAEGVDQTRGWFYTLIVLSTALFNKPAFKNVIVNGIVLAEDGEKMSKRLKNYPEPEKLIEKYGADSLRYYLLTSPAMKAENLRFSEKGVEEVLKRFVLTLWNAYSFLVMNTYPSTDFDKRQIAMPPLSGDEIRSNNLLDKWIISELNILISEVNKKMENYDLVRASRPLREFVDKLSNWYIRRSRKRFALEDMDDRNYASMTLYYVLTEYVKLLAPFMPFLAEEIYKNLTGKDSVHLEKYPIINKDLINEKVSGEMNFVREVVSLGLAARVKNRLKVRQPLNKFKVQSSKFKIADSNLLELIRDELNVKEVEFVDNIIEDKNWAIEENAGIKVALDLNITDELRIEGHAREIVRHIQTMRKEAKYNRDDRILVKYSFSGDGDYAEKVFDSWGDYIKKECLAKKIGFKDKLDKEEFDLVKELEIGNWKLEIGIRKTA